MAKLVAKQGTWDLVANSARLYWRNIGQFMAIAAVFFLPIGLLYDLTILSLGGEGVTGLIFNLLSMFVVFFVNFLIVGEASEVSLGGYVSLSKALLRVSFRGVTGYVLTEFLGVICMMLGIGVAAIAAAILTIPIAFLFDLSAGQVTMLFLPAYMLTGLFAISMFIYIPPVVALERIFYWQAIKRSFAIAMLRKWLAVRDAFFCITLQTVIVVLFLLVAGAFSPYGDMFAPEPYDFGIFMTNVLGSVTAPIWLPLMPIYLTLAYYNIRITANDLSLNELVETKTYEAV